MRRSPLFKEFLGFGASTVLEQASRLITGLVVAALLGPAAWGYWFVLNLILRYGSLVHLGAVNGMNREVPAALGRGDPAHADRVQQAAFGFVLASYVVAALLLSGIAGLAGSFLPAADIGLTLVLLACQQLYGFASMTLKARTNFHSVTRLQWASAVTYPLFSIPGALMWGLSGFIVGQAMAYLAVYGIAVVADRRLVQIALAWDLASRAIRIGFPIMLVGVVHGLFATVDRWIVLSFMTTEALGHYSLAIMALGALGLLPQVVSQQIYPRMAFSWAQNHNPQELASLANRQRRMALVIAAPLSVAAAILAPWAIRTFLPEYSAGIAPLQITLAVPIIYTFGQGYGNVFNVVGLQGWYLLCVLIGGILNVAVSILLVGPLGLNGVAVGTVAGYVGLAAALIMFGNRAFRRLRREAHTNGSGRASGP